jgi:hypothetical protein
MPSLGQPPSNRRQELTLPDFPRKLTAMPIREKLAEFTTLP